MDPIMDKVLVLLTHLMSAQNQRELTSYEQNLYNQLLVTETISARMSEYVLRNGLKRYQDGEGLDSIAGGLAPQTPETEEH